MPLHLVEKMDAVLVQALAPPLQVTAQQPQAPVRVEEGQAVLLAALAWRPTLLPKLQE